MLGVVLLYVGIVLINNGIARITNIDAKSAAVMNVFVGLLSITINIKKDKNNKTDLNKTDLNSVRNLSPPKNENKILLTFKSYLNHIIILSYILNILSVLFFKIYS